MKTLILLLIATCLAAPLVTEDSNPATDFLKGFLEAIHETKKVEDFLKCLTNMDPIIAKIKKALDYFLKMTVDDLIKGFKLLVEAIHDLEEMLKPCMEGAIQLKKLLENIKKADFMKIILKIIANPGAFINDVKNCIEALKNSDFYTAGKCVGDVLYRLFLTTWTEEDKGAMDSIIEAVEGFISGINAKNEFDNLEECMKKIPAVYYQILAIIELLKNVNWKNLNQVIEALIVFVDMAKEIFRSIKPCKGMPDDLKKIMDILGKLDPTKFMANVMTHLFEILTKITNIFTYAQKGQWGDFGEEFGGLFYMLFMNLP